MTKHNRRPLWVLLSLLALVILLYSHVSPKDGRETEAPKQLYNLQKTGAGTTADYTATAQRIHAAVDSALARAKFSVRDVHEAHREASRLKEEGNIRWSVRQLLLILPEDATSQKVAQVLEAALASSGGAVLASQTDTYQGLAVVRLDVGIRDNLSGEPLTIITDKIYLSKQKPEEKTAVKAGGSGRIAFIIDDFGYDSEAIAAYDAVPCPLTYSVLPYRPYSREAATHAISSGHQVMLHLPMEPLSGSAQEPTSIKVGMSDEEIRQTVAKAIQATPGIIGVNNHEGSRATADRRVMRAALSVIRDNDLFFVDSRTSSQSVAYTMSRQMGLRTGSNDLFIDNNSDEEAIKDRIRLAINSAHKNGSVTVIGHARINTAKAIREMIPEIEADGIKIVFESELVN